MFQTTKIKKTRNPGEIAREFFKQNLQEWLEDGWTLNPVFLNIGKDANGKDSKKATCLTVNGKKNSPKIVVKSAEDLRNCNALLGYNKKYVTMDIDNPEILKIPENYPQPVMIIKTGRGFHYRFKNGDIKKQEKLNGGELIHPDSYGIYMPGSYHPVAKKHYKILEENKTSDVLNFKHIKPFLKKPTGGNKGFEKGNRNNTLFKEVIKDMRENHGKRIPEIIGKTKKSGLPEDEIQRTTESAINSAIAKGIDDRLEYTPSSAIETDIKNRLETLGYECRYNIREQSEEIKHKDKEQWEILDDGKDAMLFSDCHKNLKPKGSDTAKKISQVNWRTHTKALVHRNEVDPFKIWLESLPKWDNKPRLESVLMELFKIDKGYLELAKWAFKAVLLTAIIRTYRPGYKFDTMIILQGKQGIGKSSLWSCLFEKESWFSDSISFSGNDKEIIENTRGTVIVENAELAGARKAEVEKIKALITRETDKVRFAYAHKTSILPRQFVIVGTTNETCSLPNDQTGNRRFIPISLESKESSIWNNGKKVREYIKENRKQLWAEALHRYNEKEKPYLPQHLIPVADMKADEHRSKNELLEDAVYEYLADKEQKHNENLTERVELQIRLKSIVDNLVDSNIIQRGASHIGIQRDIGGILRKQGYKKIKKGSINIWVKTKMGDKPPF